MKAKTYSLFFLHASLKKTLIAKKLNKQYKQYVCGSRSFGNLTLDYMAFILLFRKITLFVQSSVRAGTPQVFFFENILAMTLYKAVAEACNEYFCFAPKAYLWAYDWNPTHIVNTSLKQKIPTMLWSGVALFSAPATYGPLLKKLSDGGWPLVTPVDMSESLRMCSTGLSPRPPIYFLPGSANTTLQERYFYAALFSRIILSEKARKL